MTRKDLPGDGEPPVRSAFVWPRCVCGTPQCPDRVAEPEATAPDRPDDRSQSEAIQRIRPLVEERNRRAREGYPR